MIEITEEAYQALKRVLCHDGTVPKNPEKDWKIVGNDLDRIEAERKPKGYLWEQVGRLENTEKVEAGYAAGWIKGMIQDIARIFEEEREVQIKQGNHYYPIIIIDRLKRLICGEGE